MGCIHFGLLTPEPVPEKMHVVNNQIFTDPRLELGSQAYQTCHQCVYNNLTVRRDQTVTARKPIGLPISVLHAYPYPLLPGKPNQASNNISLAGQ